MRKLLLITGVPVPVIICRQQVHPFPVLRIIQNPKYRIVPDGESQDAAATARINSVTRFN